MKKFIKFSSRLLSLFHKRENYFVDSLKLRQIKEYNRTKGRTIEKTTLQITTPKLTRLRTIHNMLNRILEKNKIVLLERGLNFDIYKKPLTS